MDEFKCAIYKKEFSGLTTDKQRVALIKHHFNSDEHDVLLHKLLKGWLSEINTNMLPDYIPATVNYFITEDLHAVTL